MSEIEIGSLRTGDIVHVRMQVRGQTGAGEVWVVRMGDGHGVRFPIVDIVHVEPRPPEPLKVGERVKVTDNPAMLPGVIRAIDDAEAWVRCPSGRSYTFDLRRLERVP